MKTTAVLLPQFEGGSDTYENCFYRRRECKFYQTIVG